MTGNFNTHYHEPEDVEVIKRKKWNDIQEAIRSNDYVTGPQVFNEVTIKFLKSNGHNQNLLAFSLQGFHLRTTIIHQAKNSKCTELL